MDTCSWNSPRKAGSSPHFTPRGLKHFKRLHFGVNSAAEIFNEEVRKVVAQEPNAVSIYDDILVFGATPEERDKALRHIFKLWHEYRLTQPEEEQAKPLSCSQVKEYHPTQIR